VLVGRNETRRGYNRVIRGHYKHEGDFPVVGDRVVCLKNNHDLGIFNGQPWTVLATKLKKGFVHLKLEGERDGENKPPVVSCYAHAKPFLGKELELGERRLAEEFDFGYALTVHKSQGSEWSTVFLDDEWNHDNRDKWLYTAITRAAEKITIVR
jgi:exodeoxyribonuclease V